MRIGLVTILLPPLLLGASAPAAPTGLSVEAALDQAKSEARAAEREMQRLNALAERASNEALRLRARQVAAAQAISAAEAQISAADAQARLLSARLDLHRRSLARQQAPAAALLAGLALMAQRPPLLAVADGGSLDEFVKVRILLDSTLPEIRERTGVLTREIERSRTLERSLQVSQEAMRQRRAQLDARRAEFAALELEAIRFAERVGDAALGAGDVALATREESDRLSGAAVDRRQAVRLAGELAALGPLRRRPFQAAGDVAPVPLDYRLPAGAAVIEGFGAISPAGIRSRGVLLDTRTGDPLAAPADGRIRFAGPYRRHDGIVIIDHGSGWLTLIINTRTRLASGQRIKAGQPLGHALGRISVELSQNGRHLSPALIAGSSANLSKKGKRG